jgi:hypothetical protein
MTSPVACAVGLPCSCSSRANSFVRVSSASAIASSSFRRSLPAFAEAQRRPGRKRRLGRRHRLVKLGLVGARTGSQHAARGRVEDVQRHGAIDQLAVDQHLVSHCILQKLLVIARAAIARSRPIVSL